MRPGARRTPRYSSHSTVTTAGSLGCLVPPSIPMLVYAISVTGTGAVDVRELFLAGIGAALAVGAFGTITGLDRERAFYPTILVVIASYYILFAAMAGSVSALGPELLIFALFAAVAEVLAYLIRVKRLVL